MILRFGVSNSSSIRTYQEVSFAAAAIRDPGVKLLHVDGLRRDVLPTIGIYGANASGKSNLLEALRFVRSGVLNSHNRSQSDPIGRDPFRLDPTYKKKPSRFDCDFVLDRHRYQYGFSVTDKVVVEEWLYAYDLSQKRITRQTWFHRNTKESEQFYFGSALKGKNRTIESLVRPNSLYLSSAAQNNHEQLSPLFQFFKDKIIFSSISELTNEVAVAKYLDDPKTKRWVLDFLKFADTGILDISAIKTKVPKSYASIQKELYDVVNKYAGKEIKIMPSEPADTLTNLNFSHVGAKGKDVVMKISDESSGTRALLGILGSVFDVLTKGKLLVIDELNTNMHTLVSRQLIRLFGSATTNPGQGQLLFATHDTNLLCEGVMRRDQIWFTEKGPDGGTRVYPLTDIHTRQTDNIEKGYLQGRFGAIPFFSNLATQ